MTYDLCKGQKLAKAGTVITEYTKQLSNKRVEGRVADG